MQQYKKVEDKCYIIDEEGRTSSDQPRVETSQTNSFKKPFQTQTIVLCVALLVVCAISVGLVIYIKLHHITVHYEAEETEYKIDGEMCKSIEGVWYNQVGSELILQTKKDGKLMGEYRTAVERNNGSSGTSHSRVVGVTKSGKVGGVFGFTVLWNNGKSVTAWTGQCHSCDGKEVLMTSWILRTQVGCSEKWSSTIVGQGFFTRYEQKIGPRKNHGTDVPSEIGEISNYISDETVESSKLTPVIGGDWELNGYWYNELGSEIKLSHDYTASVKGKYLTAKELNEGLAGDSHSGLYGVANWTDPETTLGFVVAWNGGQSVTAWVGQYHVCDGEPSVIETSWLLRKSVATCGDHWKATSYGKNEFHRDKSIAVDNKPWINAGTEGEIEK